MNRALKRFAALILPMFALYFTSPVFADPATPSSDYIAKIQQNFLDVAAHDSALKDLLDAAIKKSGLSSFSDLLRFIKFCDERDSRGGGVLRQSMGQVQFIGRELEEPDAPAGSAPQEFLSPTTTISTRTCSRQKCGRRQLDGISGPM